MKSILKYFLFFVLGLIAVLVILAVALPSLINPNDYKPSIEAQVLKHTGRELKITGDIQLSFSFPLSVAFKLGETQLNNAKGYGSKPLVSIKHISIKAALLPLLQHNKLDVDNVIIDQVFVHLVRKPDGSSNWENLLGNKNTPDKAKKNTAKKDKVPEQKNKIPEFQVAGVDIINTHLIFDDQMNGQYIELQDLSLHSNEISEQKPIKLNFKLGQSMLANSTQKDSPLASIKQLQFDATIIPPFKQQHIEVGNVLLQQLQLNLIKDSNGVVNWEIAKKNDSNNKNQSPQAHPQASKTESANTPEQTEKPHPAANISITNIALTDTLINYQDKTTGEQFKLHDLDINISEVVENKPIKLNLSSNFDSPNNKLNGKLNFNLTTIANLQKMRFQLDNVNFQLDVNSPQIPGGNGSMQFGTDLLIDLDQQRLSINKMTLKVLELDINTSIEAKQLLTAPEFSGSLKLAEFSPKSLMQKLQVKMPKMKNAQVMEKANLNMHFSANPSQFKIKSIDASLDDISLKGNVTISNFFNPTYQFNLAINKLHLDDYTLVNETKSNPPANKKKKNPNKLGPQTTQSEQPILPVEQLRRLNLNGQLNINELLAVGIKMTNIVLSIKGKDGLVRLAPVQSDFYNGKLNLKTTINVKKDIPQIRFEQDFKQINLGQLLQDLTGKQEFTGTANISSNISTSGNLRSTLISNSHGTAKLLVTDGRINKLNILHTLRKAQAIYKGETLPTQQQEANTEFTELKGTLKIARGVIKNNDLSAKSPLMALTGKGYVNVPQEYLDYTLKVQLLNTLSIDKKTDGVDYRSYQIPYTIKGKFDQLSQQADMKKVLANRAKAELKKSLKKKLQGKSGDQLNEKLGEDVGKKLKGILNF